MILNGSPGIHLGEPDNSFETSLRKTRQNAMAETEKITINLSVVDLGKIDVLVEKGFYSSRSDLIRTAIREKLAAHDRVLEEVISTHAMGLGIFVITRKDLEKVLEKGLKKTIFVIGMLIIEKDITPELADATIESVKVYGSLRAGEAVKQVLSDRIK
jgi:Arc/MetJ-type ribon-helix-helix transcriptional regulator